MPISLLIFVVLVTSRLLTFIRELQNIISGALKTSWCRNAIALSSGFDERPGRCDIIRNRGRLIFEMVFIHGAWGRFR